MIHNEFEIIDADERWEAQHGSDFNQSTLLARAARDPRSISCWKQMCDLSEPRISRMIGTVTAARRRGVGIREKAGSALIPTTLQRTANARQRPQDLRVAGHAALTVENVPARKLLHILLTSGSVERNFGYVLNCRDLTND
jgi:hypothetical protein